MKKNLIILALVCVVILVFSGSVSAADVPSANFTANTTNGVSPVTVKFTDTSTGNPTSWNWDFGDNSTSNEQNPTHTYTTVGAYTVKLNVSNDAGSSNLTRRNYITAWPTQAAMSSNNGITFYVANDAGVKYDVPNGVNQQGNYSAIYVNNSYYIAKGGGGMNPIQLSTDPNIKFGTKTNTTNQSGTFWVVFSGGIGHLDDAILMLAVNGTIPDDFSVTITSSGYSYTIPAPALTNPATSSLTNVTWVDNAMNETFYKSDFIYGPQSWKPTNILNYPIFEGQNSSNTFSLMFIDLYASGFSTNAYPGVTNGSIKVDYTFNNLESFAAFGAYGWFSACNWGTGIPMASNIAQGAFNVIGVPSAEFTANTTSGTGNVSVQFTENSTNSPTSWLWDFGDGSTSTEQNPIHNYTKPGKYTVSLTATNAGGNNTVTKTEYINVIDVDAPLVTVNPLGGLYNTPQNVTFNVTDDSGNATVYYTIDGTNPISSATRSIYDKPVTIDSSKTIKYAAVDPAGNWSPIYTENYNLDLVAPTANVNIKGGLSATDKVIVLSTSENGTIYYTTDGSTPTNNSKKYTGPLKFTSSTTLKYIVVDMAGNTSPVYTQKYTIDKAAPKVTVTIPKSKAIGASKTATITIKFSENIKKGINWSKIYMKNLSKGKIVSIKTWISGNTLKIKMVFKRYPYNKYAIYIPASALKDLVGNNMAKGLTLKFKTCLKG